MTNRRSFLAGAAAILAAPSLIGRAFAAESGRPLPIPPIMDVDGGSGNLLEAIDGSHSFFDGTTSPTLGFGQDYLGPVLRLKKGNIARINVANKSSDLVTAHWHGLLVPGSVDGGPQLAFGPGETWSPELEIDQPATTLWYHSHVHGKTAPQVYAGLAGMIHIDDGAETGLPQTYGVDDIPLIVQDRAFDRQGRLLYNPMGPTFMMGFRAGNIVVNGAIQPQHTVPAGLVRFRILNASNARVYNFRFEDDRAFHQIASDGGLLPAPAKMTSLILAPAERAEIVVDFSNGASVRLLSGPDNNSPMGGMIGSPKSVNQYGEFEIVQFDVDAATSAAVTQMPQNFPTAPKAYADAPVRKRQFTLQMHAGGMGGMMSGQASMAISGKSMDMNVINHELRIGETEIWEINAPEMGHPFHVHGTSFQVLTQNGAEVDFASTGLKDVVLVNGTAEILVKFTKPATPQTPYMYHCHILEHEDAGMMGQFTVS